MAKTSHSRENVGVSSKVLHKPINHEEKDDIEHKENRTGHGTALQTASAVGETR